MTWYDSNFKYRQRVAVYATGGSGVPATVDAEFLVPSDWDHFWTNIRSDMFDAVATSSKGQVLTFARKAGANYSTRTLSIQVDGFFMLGGMLASRLDSYNERLDQEDIKFVNVFSYDSSGTHDDARMTELATEFGASFVRARYKAGSSGSDYAIAIEIHTTENQILQSRAILRVKDLLPS
jgi:hypothetical protein